MLPLVVFSFIACVIISVFCCFFLLCCVLLDFEAMLQLGFARQLFGESMLQLGVARQPDGVFLELLYRFCLHCQETRPELQCLDNVAMTVHLKCQYFYVKPVRDALLTLCEQEDIKVDNASGAFFGWKKYGGPTKAFEKKSKMCSAATSKPFLEKDELKKDS